MSEMLTDEQVEAIRVEYKTARWPGDYQDVARSIPHLLDHIAALRAQLAEAQARIRCWGDVAEELRVQLAACQQEHAAYVAEVEPRVTGAETRIARLDEIIGNVSADVLRDHAVEPGLHWYVHDILIALADVRDALDAEAQP